MVGASQSVSPLENAINKMMDLHTFIARVIIVDESILDKVFNKEGLLFFRNFKEA